MILTYPDPTPDPDAGPDPDPDPAPSLTLIRHRRKPSPKPTKKPTPKPTKKPTPKPVTPKAGTPTRAPAQNDVGTLTTTCAFASPPAVGGRCRVRTVARFVTGDWALPDVGSARPSDPFDLPGSEVGIRV